MARNDSPRPAAVWVSVTRYCELYSLERKTVYKYAALGFVETWQVGRVLRIRNRRPHDARTPEIPKPRNHASS
jgi:hypothetical protein